MRPWTIAHRGGALLQAENTLCAFADAVRRGCDGAELDVQLSRDSEVMVFHDARLTPALCRDADGRWLAPPGPRFKDLSFDELRVLEVGRADPSSAYTQRHPDVRWQDGECIPLLAEAIAVAKTAREPFRLFVELKTSPLNRLESAAPEELAERAVAVVEEHDFLERTIFVGFDWPALKHVKRLSPEAQCWFTTLPQSWFREGDPPPEHEPPAAPVLELLRRWAREGTSPWAAGHDAIRHGGSIIAAVKAAGGDGWFPMWVDLDEDSVAEARALGLKTGAWTVNDPSEMDWLASLGVDAICTDRPDVMLKVANSE
jgi:glycerophosphoryl diester phosphodiesterase